MAGQHGRQVVGGAEDVERAGFCEVSGEDRGGRLACPGQGGVLRRDRTGEPRPADGVPMCTAPRRTGAHAVVRAVSTQPNRPAPNGAASLAAMITIAPPASAGMILIAVGLTPGMPVTRWADP